MRVDHACEAPGPPKHHPRVGCFIEIGSEGRRLIAELCSEAGFDSLKCSIEVEYDRGDPIARILLPTEHCAYCNERRARKNGEFPDALRAGR